MRLIRESVPNHVRVLAVVKADGYGHGAVQTARAAIKGGADMLAVATVEEGTLLRKNGILQIPVLVLGAVTEEDVSEGVRWDLTQTICSMRMLKMCEKAGKQLEKTACVHIKADTGMGRIGVRSREDLYALAEAVQASRFSDLTGVYTHFSDADGDEDGVRYTRNQFEKFISMTEGLPKEVIRHCANSAAIHRFPEMALDMVRAGISLYGYPPVSTGLPLKRCMRWTSVISYIKEVPAGTYISYGRKFRTARESRIATITCGYGDGYHRLAGGKAQVLIRGHRVPVIGRICMDQMMADITDYDDIRESDEGVLMGTAGNDEITAEEIAVWSQTISYEILLEAGSRVGKEYV